VHAATDHVDAGPELRPPSRRLHLRSLIAFCILAPLALAAFLGTRDAASRDAAAAQAHRADEGASALQAVLARTAADPHSLAGVFSTAREVDAFAQFAAPGRDSSALVALAWAPHIPPSIRKAFEATSGFPIAALGPGGVAIPAPRGGEVYPVQYVTPGTANARLVGIDLASRPEVADAMRRAVATGEEQATALFDLPQGGRGIVIVAGAYQRGAAIATPTQRQSALNGFAVGFYHARELGTAAFAHLRDAGVTVRDGSTGVFANGVDAAGGVTRPVPFAGRTWQVTVRTATSTSNVLLPWVVLLAGILIALLVAAMIEQNARRLSFSEHLVAVRTVELREALVLLQESNHELDKARAAAEQASQVDALTGTYNRGHLMELIGVELNRASRGGTTPAVLLIDVDDYRVLEREHGAPVADAVLVEVASRLRSVLRSYDALGRWSTSQFGVLTPNVPNDQALLRVGEALRQVVGAAPTVVDGLDLWATVSVGAVRGSEGRAAFQLLAAADAALADARRTGHDQTVLVDDASREHTSAGEPDAMRIAHALAVSVSAREGVPETHDRDVAALAASIATAMGLTPAEVERARLAGLLHDVGKVSIPHDILTKPGALDDEEWAVMRKHAALGEEIVRRIPALAEAAEGVRHHHERFDGSGYPDRLAGVAIPLEARIVAVADAYISMTAGPSFRKARSTAAALVEIEAGRDAQFDSIVVDALVKAVSRARAA
jgi:diguanylate cyclase (GGDEF)-like protein/putative nucleotidyltransferase with HDIG domain